MVDGATSMRHPHGAVAVTVLVQSEEAAHCVVVVVAEAVSVVEGHGCEGLSVGRTLTEKELVLTAKHCGTRVNSSKGQPAQSMVVVAVYALTAGQHSDCDRVVGLHVAPDSVCTIA